MFGVSAARTTSNARRACWQATRVASISSLSLTIRSRSTKFSVVTRFSVRQPLGERLLQRDRCRIAFDAQPLDPRRLDHLRHRFQHLHARLANLQLQSRALFFELRRVARVGDQEFAVERCQQVTVVAREAGEVGDVLEIRHQQRVRLGLANEVAKSFAANGKGRHEIVHKMQARCESRKVAL